MLGLCDYEYKMYIFPYETFKDTKSEVVIQRWRKKYNDWMY